MATAATVTTSAFTTMTAVMTESNIASWHTVVVVTLFDNKLALNCILPEVTNSFSI